MLSLSRENQSNNALSCWSFMFIAVLVDCWDWQCWSLINQFNIITCNAAFLAVRRRCFTTESRRRVVLLSLANSRSRSLRGSCYEDLAPPFTKVSERQSDVSFGSFSLYNACNNTTTHVLYFSLSAHAVCRPLIDRQTPLLYRTLK